MAGKVPGNRHPYRDHLPAGGIEQELIRNSCIRKHGFRHLKTV